MTPRASDLDLTWAWENSDAPVTYVACLTPADKEAAARQALEKQYGAGRLRAMLEYAHLARSPEVGWKAAVQAVRDNDPSLLLD